MIQYKGVYIHKIDYSGESAVCKVYTEEGETIYTTKHFGRAAAAMQDAEQWVTDWREETARIIALIKEANSQ